MMGTDMVILNNATVDLRSRDFGFVQERKLFLTSFHETCMIENILGDDRLYANFDERLAHLEPA